MCVPSVVRMVVSLLKQQGMLALHVLRDCGDCINSMVSSIDSVYCYDTVPCLLRQVVADGLAAKEGLPARAATSDGAGSTSWVLTEINHRPLNLFFKVRVKINMYSIITYTKDIISFSVTISKIIIYVLHCLISVGFSVFYT